MFALILNISPLAIVLLASKAPTNSILPPLDASAIITCVIVLLVPPDAGNSILAAFFAVCVSVESAPIVVQFAAVTCCHA